MGGQLLVSCSIWPCVLFFPEKFLLLLKSCWLGSMAATDFLLHLVLVISCVGGWQSQLEPSEFPLESALWINSVTLVDDGLRGVFWMDHEWEINLLNWTWWFGSEKSRSAPLLQRDIRKRWLPICFPRVPHSACRGYCKLWVSCAALCLPSCSCQRQLCLV